MEKEFIHLSLLTSNTFGEGLVLLSDLFQVAASPAPDLPEIAFITSGVAPQCSP